MSRTLTPIPFFSDDITLVPHSISSELADRLERPLTVHDFVTATGAISVSLYTTEDYELVIRTYLPDGREVFAQGPESFSTIH